MQRVVRNRKESTEKRPSILENKIAELLGQLELLDPQLSSIAGRYVGEGEIGA